jgi:CRP-like cAMP-binding protein/anti-anti-sigma regulatory factor
MLDRWSGGLIKKLSSASGSRQEIMFNLGLVIAVTAVTVLLDLMIAVAMGLVIASLHFVVRSGDSVVRGVYTAETVHSRRVYPLDAEKALEGQGKETLIVALQGSLFFGSSDRFSRVLEESISPETRRVILDMHRVTSIDSSGGLALQQLQESLCSSGRQLAICGLPRGTAQWAFLQDLGVVEAVKPDYFFPDLDRALEWSEVLTLESLDSLDGTYLEHDLRTLDLFDGFSDEEFAALLPHLTLLQAEPGEYLFRKGDPADSMVIITQGAVHLFPGTDPASGTRLSHFGPGATFGQVSMLKGECKAASAVVDQPLKAYRLSRASMEALQNDQPRVLNRLLLALGKDLAQRVSILREELNAVES